MSSRLFILTATHARQTRSLKRLRSHDGLRRSVPASPSQAFSPCACSDSSSFFPSSQSMPGTCPGGDSDFLVGLTLGIYGLTQSVLQIPFGAASDRLGRKPVIVAGLLLFIAGSVVAAMGTTIWAVMIGRALQGAGAISAAVTALIADSVRDHVITKAMALVGASIGLTFAFSLVAAPPLTELWGVPDSSGSRPSFPQAPVWIVLKVVPDVPAVATEEADDHQPWPKVAFDPQLMRLNAGIFCLHCVQMAPLRRHSDAARRDGTSRPAPLVHLSSRRAHRLRRHDEAHHLGRAQPQGRLAPAHERAPSRGRLRALLLPDALRLGGGLPRDALLHRLQHPRGHAARPHLAHGPQGRPRGLHSASTTRRRASGSSSAAPRAAGSPNIFHRRPCSMHRVLLCFVGSCLHLASRSPSPADSMNKVKQFKFDRYNFAS